MVQPRHLQQQLDVPSIRFRQFTCAHMCLFLDTLSNMIESIPLTFQELTPRQRAYCAQMFIHGVAMERSATDD